MGVRNLYSFISKNVPNGLISVDIIQEIDKFRRNNPGIEPVIIIDLITIHSKVYTNDHEILIGGRYNIYNERMHQILTKLQSLNAKCIYFFDGPTQPNKMQTCLQRRNENYREYVKIFTEIDNGLDLSGNLQNLKIQNLVPFFQNIIDIAKSISEVRLSVLNECDQEIAKLANDMNALAIISNDTDFLIYEGKWKFWSSNDLNFQTMKTFEFNKCALRQKLSLSSRQMVLLGTLGGNDILTYEMVQDYHNRIAPRGGKFYKIANSVRCNIHSLPPKLSKSDENFIVQTVFKPEHYNEGLKNLRDSLNVYCFNNMHEGFENHILNIVSKDSTRFNFVILNENLEFILNLCYFDLSINVFMPYYSLIQQIIRRIMGILLKDQQHLKPTRKFYCKLNHSEPYEPITETPEYPSCNVPPILMLLYHPYGKDNSLDRLRLDLFCWQISSKLNQNMILQLPEENVISVTTIFYLVEKNQISLQEADCILLACNCPSDVRDTLNLHEVKQIDGRDARLAFLFTRMFNIVYNAVAAVGLNNFLSLITFDGLYFHILRKKCREIKNYLNDLVLKYQNLRIYTIEKL